MGEEDLKKIAKSVSENVSEDIKKEAQEVVKANIEKSITGLATKDEMKTIKDSIENLIEKSSQERRDNVLRAWNDDELNQNMKIALSKHLIMKAYAMGAGGVTRAQAEKAQAEGVEMLKSLIPQVNTRHQFEPNFEFRKSQFKEKTGVEIEKSAMATTTVGAGLEWLATEYSTSLIGFVSEAVPIAKQFKFITVPGGKLNAKRSTGVAGNGAYIWSVQGAATTAENTANATVGNLQTGEVNWSTFQIDAYHEASYKMITEGVIDIISETEKSIIFQIWQQVDNGIMNGAKTTEATVFTGSVVDATNVVKKVDGLRYHALTNGATVSSASAFDFDDFRSTRKSMGIYGDNQNDLVAFFSRDAFYGALDALKSYNTVGQLSTIITGGLGMLDGISKTMMGGYAMNKTKTNDSGKFDITTTANNVRGSVVICHTPSFMGIQDQNIQLFNQFEVNGNYWKFSGLYNFDFQQLDYTPAGSSPVGYNFNIQ